MKIDKPAYIEQRTEEWFRAKLGKIGCSKLGSVMSKGKGKEPSKTRTKYMLELMSERLTGQNVPMEFTNASIQWGIDHEDEARDQYTIISGQPVQLHGGKCSSEFPDLWCSPDGLIGLNGGLEIKCPDTTTHLTTLTTGVINQDYIYQMSGYILVFELDFVDFVSYDPRLPSNCSTYIHRYYANDLPVDEVKEGVKLFVDEMLGLVDRLKTYNRQEEQNVPF